MEELTFRRVLRSCFTVFMMVLFIAAAGNASEAEKSETADFFDALVKRLIADGFAQEKIVAIYKQPVVLFTPEKVGFLFVYREAKLNYSQFCAPDSIEKARRYLKRHQPAFSRAQQKFGVDKEVITAIILVETKLGRYVGNARIFNTLSTIAALADPKPRNAMWDHLKKKRPKLVRKDFEKRAIRKAAWAYTELKAFLTYAKREKIKPTKLRGSLAGAIGIAQFLPSSILAYAADGNGDGRIDLLEHADAIVSVASYLKNFGWRPGIAPDKAAKIVWQYNHSSYYVKAVLKVAKLLRG